MAVSLHKTEYESDAFKDNMILIGVLDDSTSRYQVFDSKLNRTAISFIPWQGRGSHLCA
jgi:hypothetical protein